MWKPDKGFSWCRHSLSAAFQTALFCLEIDGQEVAVIFKDDLKRSGIGYEVRFPGKKYDRICYESADLSPSDSMAVNKLRVLVHCKSIGWKIPEKLLLSCGDSND